MAARTIIAAAIVTTIGSTAAAEYPPAGIPAKVERFACSSGLLHSPGKLVIQLSVPHGTDLGIRTPAKDFFFVYSCDPSKRSPRLRDIDCQSFAQLPRITIDLATLEAASIGQHVMMRRVFSQVGEYTVLLGKNLETENTEQTVNHCKLRLGPNEIAK